MIFHRIDKENWARKPYFEHYFNLKCTFSVTANIDITALIEQIQHKGMKFYPTFIYMVSKTINAHPAFRTCFNDEGVLGYWEQMIPSYTIFHPDDKSFSSIWTEFSEEFHIFYRYVREDMKHYADMKGLFTKEKVPPNSFPISCLPWVSFNGFNLNIHNGGDYLLPIVTGGRYVKEENKTLLPISIQVHHAVCDGYHASLFIQEMQQLADDCHKWLS
ncbi:type A chloramphenicol O-acetyltransferase [Paenibacillus selenitireducens]|uniref:Chloramphenicol acetyltransferase n=1 Tax=Paenibacillus selenitireducens TaxID=1324314 RepID=A0A1T2XF42_9BACL|nr:type A chloramphenicol O-acetyltransferase [Paenibacillus selenitireducens]OPA78501.1 type A chloramphenicol O-acetyltransferase [Paenibacillus selenitireducens]